MLDVSGLNSWYGDSHIVQDIDIRVGPKERVALIGRNGVGKSTFLKSVLNAGPRTQGRISWEGQELGALPPYRRARMGIAFVPEDRRILTEVTVLENLMMAHRGARVGPDAPGPEEILNRFPMLVPLAARRGDQLSGGQQQMLAVARAIAAQPRLLLLDEPTEGLAPVIVEELAQSVITACEEAGTALLLCEQNLWFARTCTTAVNVMDAGHVVFSGSWAEFDADSAIRDTYLAI